ncbi:hypothetical protein QEN19_000661 [Hanseniaspora menglaensis]
MKVTYHVALLVSLLSFAMKIAAEYTNDVTLLLAKQNNKYSDLLKEPASLELTLPEEDELLKVIVKNNVKYDFNSLIVSVNGIEQAYALKLDDKKVLSTDTSVSSEIPEYTWSLQITQLPKTLLYYAINENALLEVDLILKSENGLVKRSKIFDVSLLQGEEFSADFKKAKNFNKGINSDFKVKEIIRHVFNAPSKQAPEELAIIFSFLIGLTTFMVVMIQLKNIAESDKQVVTLKKSCGTLSYMSMFLTGVFATEYTFLQYYLNNLSIFGLLQYAFFSLILTIWAGIKLTNRLF